MRGPPCHRPGLLVPLLKPAALLVNCHPGGLCKCSLVSWCRGDSSHTKTRWLPPSDLSARPQCSTVMSLRGVAMHLFCRRQWLNGLMTQIRGENFGLKAQAVRRDSTVLCEECSRGQGWDCWHLCVADPRPRS